MLDNLCTKGVLECSKVNKSIDLYSSIPLKNEPILLTEEQQAAYAEQQRVAAEKADEALRSKQEAASTMSAMQATYDSLKRRSGRAAGAGDALRRQPPMQLRPKPWWKRLLAKITALAAAVCMMLLPATAHADMQGIDVSNWQCGIDIAKRVFELVGGNFSMDIRIHDGEQVKKGDIIATMTGSTKTLLKGERTALNILQHMSGIATATHQCVELVAGTNAQITDTRKTLPGLRPLQKYAVTVGGGKNHRYNLSDGAMLKDNHIDAYGGITPAVAALRKKIGHMVKIEVEVRTLEELEEALSAGADIIMLDNMSCEDMTKAVQRVNGKVMLEASGNVTAETIRGIAETGVDIISLGALTHSVKCFDISMRISEKK